jgi:hypothetical protein
VESTYGSPDQSQAAHTPETVKLIGKKKFTESCINEHEANDVLQPDECEFAWIS